MSILGPILGFAGSLLAGSASSSGQAAANAANAEIAAKNNEFNAEQAGLNRDFQERMANTQWSRAVGDMRSAGLNPMLAYSQGGNSAPQGATAQSSGNPRMENTLGGGVASALSAAALASQIELQKAQAAKTNAEASVITTHGSNQALAGIDRDTSSAYASRESGKQLIEQSQRTREEIKQVVQQTTNLKDTQINIQRHSALMAAQADLANAENRFVTGRTTIVEFTRQLEQARAQLAKLEIPKATNEANQESTWWKTYVAPYLNDANSVTRSLGNVINAVPKVLPKVLPKVIPSVSRGRHSSGPVN